MISGGSQTTRRSLGDAALAIGVVGIVGMMIVPLPTPVLDVLLAANIAIGVLLLLVAIYLRDGLAFAAFPTVLLVTTLYRLALNVSSTRLILLQADAGEVIYGFGNFVVRGNYVVGAIVFLILTLIQFIVIAKGSERVAEVGARFALDAMPGKQMSIDAELRSGSITHDDARRRRRALAREAQFYGAMDGAMKFVKGDAIAGIVITCVNIVGGLVIGVAMRGLSAPEALRTYGLLTIGDGLVTQIPALLISTAAGIVVTRVASEEDGGTLGDELAAQLFGNRKPLLIAAAFLSVLAVVPGLPAVPFLVLAGLLAATTGAFGLSGLSKLRPSKRDSAAAPDTELFANDAVARKAARVAPVMTIRISHDLGSTANVHGAVRDAIEATRGWTAEELGIPSPSIELRVDRALAPSAMQVAIHEVNVATREIPRTLILDPKAFRESITGWLQVVISARAPELVGIDEAQSILDRHERVMAALVRNSVPKPVSLTLFADVLRRLVEERISIRPMREILETLAMIGANERDAVALTEQVRSALRRHISARFVPTGKLIACTIDPSIEEMIRGAIQRTPQGTFLTLPPAVAREIGETLVRALGDEREVVLLTNPDVRRFVRRLVEPHRRDAIVLSYAELAPEVEVSPFAHAVL